MHSSAYDSIAGNPAYFIGFVFDSVSRRSTARLLTRSRQADSMTALLFDEDDRDVILIHGSVGGFFTERRSQRGRPV
jgi:hypothetical protein